MAGADLDMLREPPETPEIALARERGRLRYPARCQRHQAETPGGNPV